MTKERPILFSGPMVRAILEGRKTQTRRAVKLPHTNSLGEWESTMIGGENGGRTAAGETVPLQGAIWHTRTGDCLISPYGQPGDRLWVRETHLNWWKRDEANPDGPRVFSHVAAYAADGYELQLGEKWIPSIHMLRAASRITLEIKGVRIERLREISESDAASEGTSLDYLHDTHRAAFRELWHSINGADSWNANPWVWIVDFKRVFA